MKYIAAYHTDVGLTKKTNQDSMAMKIVETKEGRVAFAIVCDGMGGLSKGELASKEVILAFCNWFDDVFLKATASGMRRSPTLPACSNGTILYKRKIRDLVHLVKKTTLCLELQYQH